MQHDLDRQLAGLPNELHLEMDRLVADGTQWRDRIETRPYMDGSRPYARYGTFLIVEWRPTPAGSIVPWEEEQQQPHETQEYSRAPSTVPVAGTSEMLLNFATAQSMKQFLIRYMRYQVLLTKLIPGEQHAQVDAPAQPAVERPLPPNTVDAD